MELHLCKGCRTYKDSTSFNGFKTCITCLENRRNYLNLHPETKQKQNEGKRNWIASRRTDPEFLKKGRNYMKQKRKDPLFKEKEKKYLEEWRKRKSEVSTS